MRNKDVALELWAIIDDIDTFDDIFKGDSEGYRNAIRDKVKERFNFGTSDGYTVELK